MSHRYTMPRVAGQQPYGTYLRPHSILSMCTHECWTLDKRTMVMVTTGRPRAQKRKCKKVAEKVHEKNEIKNWSYCEVEMKFKDNRVTELIQFCILSGRRNCSDVTVVSLEVLIDDKLKKQFKVKFKCISKRHVPGHVVWRSSHGLRQSGWNSWPHFGSRLSFKMKFMKKVDLEPDPNLPFLHSQSRVNKHDTIHVGMTLSGDTFSSEDPKSVVRWV